MDISLNQQTYERLKKDIMTFSLKPGEPVSAQKVAERYEVSRTPAREALVRLQDEGLVDIFPQSRSVVSRISRKRVRQEWFVRKSLELAMVEAFFDKLTDKDLSDMQERAAAMLKAGEAPRTHETAFAYLKCDDDFHSVMYRVAGETLAASIIENTLPDYHRIRLLVDLDNVYRDRTIDDHARLIELAVKKDVKGYYAMLDRHLSHIVEDMKFLGEQFPELFEDAG